MRRFTLFSPVAIFISFLIVCLLSVFISNSCKKIGYQEKETKIFNPEDKFLRIPSNAPIFLQRIAAVLNNQDKEILEKLSIEQGFPVWDKVTISKAEIAGKGNSEEDSVIIVPMVIEDSNEVHSFMRCTLGETVDIEIHNGNNYAYYGFGDSSYYGYGADDIAATIMELNYVVFGYSTFKILDQRLFRSWSEDINLPLVLFKIGGQSSIEAQSIFASATICTRIEIWNYDGQLVGFELGEQPDWVHSEWVCHEAAIWIMYSGESGGGGGGSGGGGGTPPFGGGGNVVIVQPPTAPPPDYPISVEDGWEPFIVAQLDEIDYSQIDDPCLESLIQEIGRPGHNSFILKAYDELQYTPNTTHKYKVVYAIDNTLTGDNGQPIPGETNVIQLSDGTNEVTITLNPTFFQTTSKEWVTTVILHELLHGIVSVLNPSLINDKTGQHMLIFSNGVLAIWQSLHELFPNLDQYDGIALGMDGLDDAYLIPDPNNPGSKMVDPDRDEFAQTNYGQNIYQAVSTASSYREGNLGTPYC